MIFGWFPEYDKSLKNEEKILHTCLIENSGNIQVLIKTELEKNNILIEDHKINHVVS